MKEPQLKPRELVKSEPPPAPPRTSTPVPLHNTTVNLSIPSRVDSLTIYKFLGYVAAKHETVLCHCVDTRLVPVQLDVLKKLVDEWVAEEKKAGIK